MVAGKLTITMRLLEIYSRWKIIELSVLLQRIEKKHKGKNSVFALMLVEVPPPTELMIDEEENHDLAGVYQAEITPRFAQPIKHEATS